MSEDIGFLRLFAHQLVQLPRMTEKDLALAILWRFDVESHDFQTTIWDLIQNLKALRLKDNINATRFASNLGKGRFISSVDGVRIALTPQGRLKLTEKYGHLLNRPAASVIPVAGAFVPTEMFQGTRPPWIALVKEINDCYGISAYDGAAVLARRLVEVLIVEWFEAEGKADAIKDDKGNYKMMDGLAGVLQSGQPLQLSRSGKSALEPVKKVGDTAAHHRHYITPKADLDQIGHDLRKLLTELLEHVQKATAQAKEAKKAAKAGS